MRKNRGEFAEIMKGKYTFYTFAKETKLGKVISYVVPHLPNRFVTGILQLTTCAKVLKDKVKANASHNRNLLRPSSDKEKPSDEEVSPKRVFISGEFIENQAEWRNIKYGTTTMAYAGCEIMSIYNAQLALGCQMTADEVVELISKFERRGALFKGELGTSWIAIANYFKKAGYDVVRTYSRRAEIINPIGKNCDTIIITAYNDKDDVSRMIHTITVTKDEDGYYTLHNAYKRNTEGEYVSFSGKEEKDHIETLDGVISHLSNGNAAPMNIIGIRKTTSSRGNK